MYKIVQSPSWIEMVQDSIVSGSCNSRKFLEGYWIEWYHLKRLDFPGGTVCYLIKSRDRKVPFRGNFCRKFFVYCFTSVSIEFAESVVNKWLTVLTVSYFEKLPPTRIISIQPFYFVELCGPAFNYLRKAPTGQSLEKFSQAIRSTIVK